MRRVTLDVPAKRLRAECIAQECAGRVVCFTCGNAAAALRAVGLEVVEISPHGQLAANGWCTTADVRRMFPQHFDATSGHLPVDLMLRIGHRLTRWLEDRGVRLEAGVDYVVPSGSGETVVCLKLANPCMSFVARYDGTDPATRYEKENPLNAFVRHLAKVEIMG